MKYVFHILIFVSSLSCKAQNTESKGKFDMSDFEHPELIADFVSSEWVRVYNAKDSLLNIGKSVIPDLLKLMDDPKAFEKLQNTADLIYPGAIESLLRYGMTKYWGAQE